MDGWQLPEHGLTKATGPGTNRHGILYGNTGSHGDIPAGGPPAGRGQRCPGSAQRQPAAALTYGLFDSDARTAGVPSPPRPVPSGSVSVTGPGLGARGRPNGGRVAHDTLPPEPSHVPSAITRGIATRALAAHRAASIVRVTVPSPSHCRSPC